MTTVYRAFDGTVFEEERECLEHDLLGFFDSERVRAFDAMAYRMSINKNEDIVDECKRFLDEAVYLHLSRDTTYDEDDMLQEELDVWNFPCEAGDYVWDSDESDWVLISDKIEELNEMLTKMKGEDKQSSPRPCPVYVYVNWAAGHQLYLFLT